MGLIYVNPEGPNGNPDPLASARDIRDTFARMAMNDEETVALIAGGHTFGKTHGAGDADLVGPEPEGAPLEEQGLGWKSAYGSGKGADAITSGLEVTWTTTPTRWSNDFFKILFGYEWELTKSPAGAHQWVAKDAEDIIPGPTPDSPKRKPTMLTSDLALRFDPAYEKISRRFLENPNEFALAFAKAWYKLLHRDMGPVDRYLGPWVPEPQLWQDPVPAAEGTPVSAADVATPQGDACSSSGLSVSELVSTAWASAATFRSHRQARWRQRRPDPPRAAARLGGQPARAARRGPRQARGDPGRVQRRRRCAGLAGRPDRARRLRGGREGGEGRRASRSPCRSAPVAPTPPRSRPTSTRSRCSSRGPTASATTCGPARSCSRRRCWSSVPTCSGSRRRR